MSEEATTRMTAIQDREMDQFKELSHFLDLEMKFVRQYLDVLQDLKEDWIDT